MPRVKRKPKFRREGITEAHIDQLLTGHDFFNKAFGRRTINTQPDWDAMRDAWDAMRDELLPAFIANNPFLRPAAWWLFSAPEPRRKIPRHYPAEQRAAICRHSGEAVLQQLLRVAEMYPSNEREREYLQRHGLLTDAECRTPRRDVCEL